MSDLDYRGGRNGTRSVQGAVVEGSVPSIVATVPRLALRVEEASAALGVGVDYFRDHVLGDLRVIRRGRLRLIPVVELERWLRENAARGGLER